MGDRLSGQPHPGARGRRRHSPDHRAPGAHRAAHGGGHLARHQRQEARRVRHAARARHRERLRRRGAGLQRVRADPGHADGLCAAVGLERPPLQCQLQHGERDQVGRADHVGQADPRHLPPRLHAAAVGPRRPGAGGDPDRRLERGDRRGRSRAGEHVALGPRSGRHPRGRLPAAQGQAPRALRRPGRALGAGVGRGRAALRAARHSRLHQSAGQERVPGNASPVARLRRPRHHRPGQSFPARGRPDLRHRLQLRRDQLRREDAGRQDHHPRHARPRRRQPGCALGAGRAGRCQARARGCHRGSQAPGCQAGEGPEQGRGRDQGALRQLARRSGCRS